MSSQEAYLKEQLSEWGLTEPTLPDQYRDELALFHGLYERGAQLRFDPRDQNTYAAVAFNGTRPVVFNEDRMSDPALQYVDMVALFEDSQRIRGVQWHRLTMHFSRLSRYTAPQLYGSVVCSGILHPEKGRFVGSPWETEMAFNALTFVAARDPRPARVSKGGLPISGMN